MLRYLPLLLAVWPSLFGQLTAQLYKPQPPNSQLWQLAVPAHEGVPRLGIPDLDSYEVQRGESYITFTKKRVIMEQNISLYEALLQVRFLPGYNDLCDQTAKSSDLLTAERHLLQVANRTLTLEGLNRYLCRPGGGCKYNLMHLLGWGGGGNEFEVRDAKTAFCNEMLADLKAYADSMSTQAKWVVRHRLNYQADKGGFVFFAGSGLGNKGMSGFRAQREWEKQPIIVRWPVSESETRELLQQKKISTVYAVFDIEFFESYPGPFFSQRSYPLHFSLASKKLHLYADAALTDHLGTLDLENDRLRSR